jgi:hypothetical protein
MNYEDQFAAITEYPYGVFLLIEPGADTASGQNEKSCYRWLMSAFLPRQRASG